MIQRLLFYKCPANRTIPRVERWRLLRHEGFFFCMTTPFPRFCCYRYPRHCCGYLGIQQFQQRRHGIHPPPGKFRNKYLWNWQRGLLWVGFSKFPLSLLTKLGYAASTWSKRQSTIGAPKDSGIVSTLARLSDLRSAPTSRRCEGWPEGGGWSRSHWNRSRTRICENTWALMSERAFCSRLTRIGSASAGENQSNTTYAVGI